MPDILANWRKAPKENRAVNLRINTIKVVEDHAADRGISFDEALDALLMYAFLQNARQEILSFIASAKSDISDPVRP